MNLVRAMSVGCVCGSALAVWLSDGQGSGFTAFFALVLFTTHTIVPAWKRCT